MSRIFAIERVLSKYRTNVWKNNFIVMNPRGHEQNENYRYHTGNSELAELMSNNPARSSTGILENFYVRVANYYKNTSYKLVRNFYRRQPGLWTCTITVQWPSTKEFTAEQSKKNEAARDASLLAIEWLESQNKIDHVGRPLLVQESNPSVSLELDNNTVESINDLRRKFEEQIHPLYDEINKLHEAEDKAFFEDHSIPSYRNLDSDKLQKRNTELERKVEELPAKSVLPIDSLCIEIVRTIQSHRVVILKGHTGSGKTTRVPQMIFDSYMWAGKGAECNIVITQPRRLSATSLASRIAYERNENIGFSVGFHVRLNSVYPTSPGSIMFVSTGILLQRMIFDADLSNVSHVIIDEAHERDVNTDLLLQLMKDLLRRNEHIRIVIMSATINAELFQRYFDDCPLISVPGITHKVDTFYVEDILTDKTHFRNNGYEWDTVDIDDNLILDAINWIHVVKEPGAILVFLPGWSEINKLQTILEEDNDLVVVAAHSKLQMEQQQLIFKTVPPGKRKVILATNIAESSITIPDVVYVIDSGIVKETGNYNGISGLTDTWISKAVADQRKGRAGRLKDGECYRLYSKKKYDSFQMYPTPEVMRTPLEKLIVNIKMYQSEKLLDSLSKFPQPPPQNAITDATTYLQILNILDMEENLTPLGRRIAPFALHPTLSVALAYSIFFDCLEPMLVITSLMSENMSVFGIDVPSSIRRTLLGKYHPTDDNVAMFNLFKEWKETFMRTNPNLSNKSLQNANQILKLNLNYLYKAHLLAMDELHLTNDVADKEYANELKLISPLFLAATGKLAVNARPYSINGKVNNYLDTLEGLKVKISKDSVNFKNNELTSPFLTFYNMNMMERFLRVYDTATLSAHAVLLFCPVLPKIDNSDLPNMVNVEYPNIGVKITARAEVINSILHLRDILWKSVDFYIRNYDAHMPESESINQFKKDLRLILNKLL